MASFFGNGGREKGKALPLGARFEDVRKKGKKERDVGGGGGAISVSNCKEEKKKIQAAGCQWRPGKKKDGMSLLSFFEKIKGRKKLVSRRKEKKRKHTISLSGRRTKAKGKGGHFL